MTLDGVLVWHAYQRRQLELDLEAPIVEPRKGNFLVLGGLGVARISV